MSWTEERISDLVRLWATGRSASEIGRALGVSKNAVIGKAHRLKLPARPSPIRSSPGPKVPKPARLPKRVRKVRSYADVRPRRARKGESACLWPIGEPEEPDFHFCEAEVVPGKPYCAEHCARAYVNRSRDDLQAA